MEEVYDYKNSYKAFTKIPMIALIVIIVFSFVWGIVDSCIFESGYGSHRIYGSFHVKSGFVNWFIWQLILVPSAIINFLLAKVVISPIVLQTEYLRLIAIKQGAYEEELEETEQEEFDLESEDSEGVQDENNEGYEKTEDNANND